MTETTPLKCDLCGRFIKWDDFDTGKAFRRLEPSYSRFEDYFTYHVSCLDKQTEKSNKNT
jgi:hypothetical protein